MSDRITIARTIDRIAKATFLGKSPKKGLVWTKPYITSPTNTPIKIFPTDLKLKLTFGTFSPIS
jgi:hypothetical protein